MFSLLALPFPAAPSQYRVNKASEKPLLGQDEEASPRLSIPTSVVMRL